MQEKSTGSSSPTVAPDGPRRDDRDSLFVTAHLRPHDRADMEEVRVRNVSSGGLMAQVARGYTPGMRIEIELEGIGRIDGSVAWTESGRIGVAFDHPVDKRRARKSQIVVKAEMFKHNADHRRPPLKPR